MENGIDQMRHRFLAFSKFFLIASVIAAASGCATSRPAGSPPGYPVQTMYYQGLEMPENFHMHPPEFRGLKATLIVPPDSWVVFDRSGFKVPVSSMQPKAIFVAVRQSESAPEKFKAATELVTIAVEDRPAVSPQSGESALEKASIMAECPGAVTRTDIRTAAEEFLYDEVVAPCGAHPYPEDAVIRALYGKSIAFRIVYVRFRRTLDSQERGEAVALVSSFKIADCSSSGDVFGCSKPIYFRRYVPRPASHP